MNVMRRLMAIVALVLGSVMLVAPAQAYPDPADPTITIDPHACAGNPVPYFAEASISGDWTVTYKGITETDSGTTRIEGTFPSVKSDAGVSNVFTATVVNADNTLTASTNVVLPSCDGTTPVDNGGDNDNSALPGTGSDLSPWWLVAAAGAIIAGAGILVRRRQH